MTPRERGWRGRAAADLVLKHLPDLGLAEPVLVMEDPLPDVVTALGERGLDVTSWSRRALGGRPASAWPPEGPFASALLRLPKAKDELEMAVHAAAHRVAPGGRLYVYGAKDEGAGSAARRIEPLWGEVGTVATGGRCRLMTAVRPDVIEGLRAPLRAWRIEGPPPHPELEEGGEGGRGPDAGWVSYPGVFAAGRLDEGTALLLDTVPTPDAGTRVLDFGCGDGVVGGVLGTREPTAELHLLDVDAVALEAARENVSAATSHLGHRLAAAGEEPFDAVVSNPPYHSGKAETLDVIERLIREAPTRLTRHGWICLVAQRRLPVERMLGENFEEVRVLADRRAFRVWWGRRG